MDQTKKYLNLAGVITVTAQCVKFLLLICVVIACRDSIVIDVPNDRDESIITIDNKLIKIVCKSPVSSGPQVGLEIFENEGKILTVAEKYTLEYSYDTQGRVSNELRTTPSGDTTLTFYTYQKNQILLWIKFASNSPTKQLSFASDTIQLNEQGLAVIAKDKIQRTYNSSRQAISSKSRYSRTNYTILKNNTVKIDEFSGYGHGIYYSVFDTMRINKQPNIFPFLGKNNKNIVTQNTLEINESPYYTNTKAYQIDFSYLWDEYGRIIRQLKIGKKMPGSNWPYEEDTYGVGVYHFYYK